MEKLNCTFSPKFCALEEIWQSFKMLVTSNNQKDMQLIGQEIHQKTGMKISAISRYLSSLMNLINGKNIVPKMTSYDLDFFLKRIKGDLSNATFYHAIKTLDVALSRYGFNEYPDLRALKDYYFSASLMKSDIDVLNVLKEKSNEPMMFTLDDLPPFENYITRVYGDTPDELFHKLYKAGIDIAKDTIRFFLIVEGSRTSLLSDLDELLNKLPRIIKMFLTIKKGMYINKNQGNNLYYLVLFHDSSITLPVHE